MTHPTPSHAALMDATYRHQRFIYDATRRHYLLGRDHLLDHLNPPPRGHILEIACGTGRNLARIARDHPETCLYGLDISSEMLTSARSRLGTRVQLAEADACDFDGKALFGTAQYDRILLSYSLSMIPDWQRALRTAVDHLAPGGELHLVDFSDQARLPRWFRGALRGWLARFHVEPRTDLSEVLSRTAQQAGGIAVWQALYRDYAQHGVLMRAA